MQNENLQNETAKQTQTRPAHRLSRKVRLSILGVSLFIASAMGAAALNHFVPKLPNRSFTDRVAWYVHQGQWRADARTMASAFSYIVSSESENPSAAVPMNPSVARNAAPTMPKS